MVNTVTIGLTLVDATPVAMRGVGVLSRFVNAENAAIWTMARTAMQKTPSPNVSLQTPQPRRRQIPNEEFEMTQEALDTLLESMKPVPLIMLQCGRPTSHQENVNNAWKRLGTKMGFEHMSVKPVRGKGRRFFTAVPTKKMVKQHEN